MRNCYVDRLLEGRIEKGHIVFQLNTFELDRDTFKLANALTLLQLTEDRLADDYLDELILKPIAACVSVAESDEAAARKELEIAHERMGVGEYTIVDVKVAEARLAEREIVAIKARLERDQRKIEIEVQQRQVKAERIDLEQRVDLNKKIREIHEFGMPFTGKAEAHTFQGAFVERGDPICTVSV